MSIKEERVLQTSHSLDQSINYQALFPQLTAIKLYHTHYDPTKKPMMRIITFILLLIRALDAEAKNHHESVYTATPYPNITISVWTGNNCNPNGTEGPIDFSLGQHLDMIPIAENYVLSGLYGSYWLSRDLINTERLDWSTCPDGSSSCDNVGDIKGPCRLFRLRTSPDINDHELRAYTCYLLNPQVSVSHLHVGRVHALRTDTCMSSA